MRLLPCLLLLGSWLAIESAYAQDVINAREISHIHGLAADPGNSDQVFVASHHGLFLARPDGKAVKVSATSDDFMGFVAHPSAKGTFFASGHPQAGGLLGMMVSTDGGANWRQQGQGADGPADFHVLKISKSNPDVIYGVFRTLQRSDNGGKTWRAVGAPPEGTIDLAVSGNNPDVLYAATRQGLWRSDNGGVAWVRAHPATEPVTTVESAPDGRVIAYFLGSGLSSLTKGQWEPLAKPSGDFQYLLHLNILGQTAYALTDAARIVVSRDGGKQWKIYGE
jgi:hypothetical protein